MPAEKYSETKYTLPPTATIEAIFAHCDMMSVISQKNFSLPTLQMLQESLLKEDITPIGKEWTSEGYIFDGLTGKVDMNPPEGLTAKYRIIELYQQSSSNDPKLL